MRLEVPQPSVGVQGELGLLWVKWRSSVPNAVGTHLLMIDGPVCPSAAMRGIPSLPEAFVLFAANSGRIPSACHAGSFRRTRTGTTIRRKIAGKIRGRKKRRELPDRYASLQASPFRAGCFTVAEVLMVGFTQIYLTRARTAFLT